MKLKQLVDSMVIKKSKGSLYIDIAGIKYNSKTVEKGDLFVCIRGYNLDGHDFLAEALENGATAVILEKWMDTGEATAIQVSNAREALSILSTQFYHNPSQNFKLVGVTGTNGKTTTTYLIESIFNAAGEKTGVIGTLGYKIDGKEYKSHVTTPESLELQKILAQMMEQGVSCVSMEVSSHALKQKRIFGCDFNAAVFTNLYQDHLDYHADLEDYRAAKGRFFSFLGTSFQKSSFPKAAIINMDDAHADYMMQQAAVQAITYGIEKDADVKAQNIEMFTDKSNFTIATPWGNVDVTLDIPGRFSIYNALAASAAALTQNIDLHVVKEGLEHIKGIPGRFENVHTGRDFAVIVDYAHTTNSLENILSTLREFAPGRIGVVFGCGGDRDRTKRPSMGSVAAKYGDMLFITSDNPRSEDPVKIIEDILEGIEENRSYIVEPDRRKAISEAVNWAEADDIILIAGKGHEAQQEFKDRIIEFDDKKVVKEEIGKLQKQ